MTQEEIIEMAKEVSLAYWHKDLKKWQIPQGIEAFAKLVAAKEREKFAKFFDDNDTLMFWGSQAAREIRARGEA